MPGKKGPLPSRWTLRAIQASVNWMKDYSLSGAWRILQGYGLTLRSAQMRHWSPDPDYEQIFVAQDNWSIHQHPDVVAALKSWPTIKPVWLPTYSPWLNPIEKLRRWLRSTVLKMHRLAEDWKELLQRVYAFLNQFAYGSQDLLRYVGLLVTDKLARAIAVPCLPFLIVKVH